MPRQNPSLLQSATAAEESESRRFCHRRSLLPPKISRILSMSPSRPPRWLSFLSVRPPVPRPKVSFHLSAVQLQSRVPRISPVQQHEPLYRTRQVAVLTPST